MANPPKPPGGPPPIPITMGSPVIVAAPELPAITYVQAKYYRRVRRQPPIWLVLHATHGREGPGSAMACAIMFRDLPPERPCSAHYAIDTTTIVQCVSNTSEAWHAGARGNLHGESFELCGRADQTRAQWIDAASLPMLELTAQLLRVRADVLGIPLTLLTPTQVRALDRGVVLHSTLSRAFPADTNHSDPGSGFPAAELVAAAAAARGVV